MGARQASCGVAVMAKASAPGRTKTRLVPPLTYEEAAGLNTAFLRDVAANLDAARAAGAPLASHMAYGPPGSESFFRDALPPGIGLIESWLPSFGACLFHAVTALFARGHEAACVLNADSPTLPTGLLVELADRLARPGDRAVLGPAEDGGYWVLGLKAPHRRLFEAIDWSTERVAAQTLARAAEIGLPVEILPTWYDVDDRASLRRLVAEVLQGVRPGPGMPALHPAPATAAFLRDAFARTDLADRLDLARPRESEVA
ncbi:TIGR04282 family arsenosugar biosynthesis glycosyltransferase [Methylobacterium nonmethylotrophicum]|uniref:Glycosyltransferase n=1 Tax=Methylobacterium nonmethylotrophicum TaxID=1141884 RepID=A0A4Z0NFT7_9HYPH|nr:TIGR04282 family arsenosugar biosynthesis glycosyltransferase [Methylobacterium nonmethylotrophicum]TGD95111.1 glycosyltransferase [Methylobacterium nonmethylotrophicum]